MKVYKASALEINEGHTFDTHLVVLENKQEDKWYMDRRDDKVLDDKLAEYGLSDKDVFYYFFSDEDFDEDETSYDNDFRFTVKQQVQPLSLA